MAKARDVEPRILVSTTTFLSRRLQDRRAANAHGTRTTARWPIMFELLTVLTGLKFIASAGRWAEVPAASVTGSWYTT